MKSFFMNGYLWHVYVVESSSPLLIDRSGELRVATTDPITKCVYLSDKLSGPFLKRVLIHELGHCALVSFDLLDDIHRMVKKRYWIEAEEWVCNLIADYGLTIFEQAYHVLGEDAWLFIPRELERLIA